MSPKEEDSSQNFKENFLIPKSEDEDMEDFFSDFDLAKLLVVASKSIGWIILLLITSLSAAFVYNRYTKPVYESASLLKLDLKSDAGVLGFRNFKDESVAQASKLTIISGEIELIKSRVIYEKIIQRMNLDVSYYAYGNVLYDERYNASPFKVKFQIINPAFYDFPFDVEILDQKRFRISYVQGDNEISSVHDFGSLIQTDNFIFTLTLEIPQPDIKTKYFFIINSKEALLAYLMNNVSVEILNLDANLIRVGFKDHNKFKACDIVNAINSVYLEQTIATKSQAHEQTIKFLEASLLKTDSNLTKAEVQLESFIKANKTVDAKLDFAKHTTKLEELDLEKLELKINITLLNDLLDHIINNKDLNLFIPSLSNLSDSQLENAIANLNILQQERERLLSSQKENTFVIKSKNQAISTLRSSIISIISQNKKLLFQQINEINKKAYELETTLLSLPSKETELTRLKRFYSLYEKFYLLLMEKQAEFGIAKAGTIPNFMILSPGLIPSSPIYPNKAFLYLTGTAIGLFLGIGLIFFRYFLQNSISTQKELEKGLKVSILGGIPQYTKDTMNVSRLIVDKNPKSAISEALRSIRTNLEFLCPNKKRRLIAVTSTVSGEGKTFVAVNLAGVIALSDQKVIILDLDMRKPKIHLAFDKENNKGMSTILIGKHEFAECINTTSIESLHFIPSGPTPPNPSELILRPQFEKLLEDLYEVYDVIVIDTPPVGLVTDGILILRRADIPLYIVRANYSKKGVKKNINRLGLTPGFGKLTVILNALNSINTYGYGGYGYGAGYGYGYYEKEKGEGMLSRIRKMISVKE